MEPFSATVAAALALVEWKKVISGLATDAAKGGTKSLLSRLKPDESGKAANYVVGFFTEQFLAEIEDKTPLSSAIPGYQEDLKRLIQHTAPEIALAAAGNKGGGSHRYRADVGGTQSTSLAGELRLGTRRQKLRARR